MTNRFRVLAISFFSLFASLSVNANDEPLRIEVKNATCGGAIQVRVTNVTTHDVSIWDYHDYSWGWGNWTFEFLRGNEMIIFVRKPDEGFTVNIAVPRKIQASGFADVSFDLSDGTWVSHTIPIFPKWPDKEEKKIEIRGCFAVLAIAPSEESKENQVWTGTAISPFH